MVDSIISKLATTTRAKLKPHYFNIMVSFVTQQIPGFIVEALPTKVALWRRMLRMMRLDSRLEFGQRKSFIQKTCMRHSGKPVPHSRGESKLTAVYCLYFKQTKTQCTSFIIKLVFNPVKSYIISTKVTHKLKPIYGLSC